MPSEQPSSSPSDVYTSMPSFESSSVPSPDITSMPSNMPSSKPTGQPTSDPSSAPSSQPSIAPTTMPSNMPSSEPTVQPTKAPSSQPSIVPTSMPSSRPTNIPSTYPSDTPTLSPSRYPSKTPSATPSTYPSSMPSFMPTTSLTPTTCYGREYDSTATISQYFDGNRALCDNGIKFEEELLPKYPQMSVAMAVPNTSCVVHLYDLWFKDEKELVQFSYNVVGGCAVDEVVIKYANGFVLYDVGESGLLSDSFLRTSGCKGISHVDFCFVSNSFPNENTETTIETDYLHITEPNIDDSQTESYADDGLISPSICSSVATRSELIKGNKRDCEGGFKIEDLELLYPVRSVDFLWEISGNLCDIHLTNLMFKDSSEVIQFDYHITGGPGCFVSNVNVKFGNAYVTYTGTESQSSDQCLGSENKKGISYIEFCPTTLDRRYLRTRNS